MASESDYQHQPAMPELTRRVQRLEDRMDLRVVTMDVFQAREAVHQTEVIALQHRLQSLETALSGATRMIVAAFLGLLVQFVVLGVALFGKGVG